MRSLVLLFLLVAISGCQKKVEITNFDECVAAGHPHLKIYPGRCTLPDGTSFVQQIPDPPSICTDNCGNGNCEEVVCLGSGCPCAETAESCPQDCKAEAPPNPS